MIKKFRALWVEKTEDSFSVSVKELGLSDLPEGDVTIRVAYSSVNYKDGLACIPNGKIVRSYPFIPGIDLAGTVVDSKDSRFKEGDQVVITGYELGVAHFGGFSEYARVPADWVVPLPKGLSLKEAMAIGTAGFTAALSVQRLEDNGLNPERGPVIVTGATGGVGSTAVAMLAGLGYHVAASTGKASEHEYLHTLGAKEILGREEVTDTSRPLQKERWAGAVDPVGGKTLAYLLSTTKYGGSVAVSGLTGGTDLATTVFPFILRGVNLLGIDSVYCPMDVRLKLWERLASDLKPANLLDQIGYEISLEELPDTVGKILKGEVRGRTVVRLEA
ncbi:NADPH:quinone oxidoreductase family protein [Effusibacillus lacus]|uniref:Quinone oxidoreductase n=1 Tax=Effusibacillus lacus TaxID=1348429 RepID=A0A292YLB0_9BACL|nr:acryloyl-CoA reductase [Effusibacillus lacus]TCS71085.1 putative YhdH/YhfP family quinone oxidoreductase [Effusibacillus lacus]GAX90728.1 quinone oxidoreductase [Effusibacillus lacus]